MQKHRNRFREGLFRALQGGETLEELGMRRNIEPFVPSPEEVFRRLYRHRK